MAQAVAVNAYIHSDLSNNIGKPGDGNIFKYFRKRGLFKLERYIHKSDTNVHFKLNWLCYVLQCSIYCI